MKELILAMVFTAFAALSFGQQIELIKDGPLRGESKQERWKSVEAEKGKVHGEIAVYLALDITASKEPGLYNVKIDKGSVAKNSVLDTLSTPYLDKMERGKIVLKSEIDVLNYLGSHGWEVISVQSKPDAEDAQNAMSRVYIRKLIKQ